MKNLFTFLRITLCLLLVCVILPVSWVSADFDVDDNLVSCRWEMKVGNWANVSYMNFYPDNIGIMEVPARYQSATESYDYNICYSFTWNTFESGTDTYINIFFEGEYHGNGWGVYNAPYKMNTYKVIWNYDMIFLYDYMHATEGSENSDVTKNITLKRPAQKIHFI